MHIRKWIKEEGDMWVIVISPTATGGRFRAAGMCSALTCIDSLHNQKASHKLNFFPSKFGSEGYWDFTLQQSN
jgi:hypothetical protein